jgi:hypothetical protein
MRVPMSLPSGAKLGPYEILSPLGAVGMGAQGLQEFFRHC